MTEPSKTIRWWFLFPLHQARPCGVCWAWCFLLPLRHINLLQVCELRASALAAIHRRRLTSESEKGQKHSGELKGGQIYAPRVLVSLRVVWVPRFSPGVGTPGTVALRDPAYPTSRRSPRHGTPLSTTPLLLTTSSRTKHLGGIIRTDSY